MLWFAGALFVVAAAAFVAGFVLFANGAGVAPQRRTSEDPTGIKRANARLAWSDVFRRMPSSLGTMLDKEASREDRLTAVGSMCVLAAVLALCAAVLALVAAFL
jgi:hypothetical protein